MSKKFEPSTCESQDGYEATKDKLAAALYAVDVMTRRTQPSATISEQQFARTTRKATKLIAVYEKRLLELERQGALDKSKKQ